MFETLIEGTCPLGLQYEFWPAEVSRPEGQVIIVLHGRGDSPEGFHWLPAHLGIETAHYLFLQAPEPYGSGFSWYDFPPNRRPGLDRSAQLLSQVIHLLQLLGIPGRRIYLFGFSQGCAVAMHYALRSTVPLGGVVGLSGFVESPQDYPAALGRAAKLHPYLVCHGFEDDMVPLQPTRDAVEQLKILGLPVDWFEGTFGHEIDPGVELDVIRESLQRWMESN